MKKLLEKDLEEFIWNQEGWELNELGININNNFSKKKRQLKLGEFGVLDLVYLSKFPPTYYIEYTEEEMADWLCRKEFYLTIDVFELKIDRIKPSTLTQGLRYVKAISDYFLRHRRNIKVSINLHLIGKEVDRDVIISASYFLEETNIAVYVYKYSHKINNFGENEFKFNFQHY